MQVLGNHQTAGSESEASAYPHNRIGPLPAFRRLQSLSANSLIIVLLSPFLALTRASVQKRAEEYNEQGIRSEEHTSELQSQFHLVCRLLCEKKKAILTD